MNPKQVKAIPQVLKQSQDDLAPAKAVASSAATEMSIGGSLGMESGAASEGLLAGVSMNFSHTGPPNVVPLWEREHGKEFNCPPLPEGMEDISWHHDACPSYGWVDEKTREELVRIWIDHPDPSKRENGRDWPRFGVHSCQIPGDYCFEEGEWEQAVAKAREMLPLARKALSEGPMGEVSLEESAREVGREFALRNRAFLAAGDSAPLGRLAEALGEAGIVADSDSMAYAAEGFEATITDQGAGAGEKFTAPEPWQEHPDYPREDWESEVANGDTNLGYSEWCRNAFMVDNPGAMDGASQPGQMGKTTDYGDGVVFTAPEPCQEHPDYPREDWKSEVANGDTNLGYSEWCHHRFESDRL